MTDQGEPAVPAVRWSRGERIVSAAGPLLAADLLLLPWHQYGLDVDLERLGVEVPAFSLDRNGLQDPNALLGVAAFAVALAMVVHVLAARVHASVPRPGPAHLVGGAVVFGLLVAKVLAANRFLGIGAWAGLALAAALVHGGYALEQDASPTGSVTSRRRAGGAGEPGGPGGPPARR